jgi:hypothetical protein
MITWGKSKQAERDYLEIHFIFLDLVINGARTERVGG